MNTGIQGIKSLFRHPDAGLLIIRIALGGILAIAGYNKFMGGEEALHAVGANIDYIGLDVGTRNISTMFFGALAAGTELIGGIFLAAGILFRPVAVMQLVQCPAALVPLEAFQFRFGIFMRRFYTCSVLTTTI